jgi:hypothetical protein
MPWHYPLTAVHQAHFRAAAHEQAGAWHLAVQHYLYCLASAEEAGDERAVRFFAAKLERAYRHMNLPAKAAYYRALVED